MSGDRDTMLGRIRSALRDVPASERPEDVPVAREYRQAGTTTTAELITRLMDRLIDYKAKVQTVSEADLPAAITAACEARGARYMVVPRDVPTAWTGPSITWLADEGLTNTQLDESDGVLTGCALAIAQTGTLVLDGGPMQGRRAITLLPDYHLCVVAAAQIVDLVPEAITRLGTEPRRPITFISGPSATSDIELNRVEGVHGPRTLEVLIVVDKDIAS